MTDSSPADGDDIQEMIRSAGLRCTSSREMVLEYLVSADAPVTHADVADELVPRGLDKATIYRNLTDLTEAGLVHRLDLGDHVWRFEYREAPDVDDEHPHFVCTDCGEVACLAPVGISFENDGDVSPAVGEVEEVFLKGRCAECG